MITKKRLLVKFGIESIPLLYENIVFIYTQNKIVYVIDRFSKKNITDKTLQQLEEELNKDVFFRANRQYIININFVKSFKPYEKTKIIVELTIPEINHPIIISQETAVCFRRWMHEVCV